MDPKKFIAIGLTHFIYRGTDAIEKKHVAQTEMNSYFYRKVYESCNYFLSIAKEREKYIQNAYDGIKSLEKYLELTNKNKKLDLHEACIIFSIGYIGFGNDDDWDLPIDVGGYYKEDDPVKYLLAGQFNYHCKKRSIMNQTVMKDINKDVCNRMYTLIISGYFD